MAKTEKKEIFSEEYRNSLGKLLDLDDDQKERLIKLLGKEINSWKSDTSTLHYNLQHWNDLVENVVEETDYPFEGAANVHIPLIAIYMKVYHSVLRRSILGADVIWYSETNIDTLKDSLPDIDDNLNYKARNVWNIEEALSEVLWTTPRDGLGVMQISQVEEYEENVRDVLYIHNIQQFMEEFPPNESGLSEQEWQGHAQRISKEATEENPVEIPIVYDKLIYKGPKGEIVELADFVTFPASARDIGVSHAKGYGKRFYLRRGEIKKKGDQGIWYKEAVDSLLSKKRKGSLVTSYTQSKDQIEGINRGTTYDECELFEVVYRVKFKRDKSERKLLIVFSQETKELLSCIDYPYRVDFYSIFRIGKRPNRLVGPNVPGDLVDINEEIDTLHNQRINSRKITEVPSFKAKKSSAKGFDPMADENRWKPGVIFWLDAPDDFVQFTVQPVDLGTSMQEEDNDIKISSLLMGIEPSLFSGSPAADNPNAPGNKTGLLIQQSNLRMDDPLSELRRGVEKVGEICLSHEYQFGPAQIEYSVGEGRGAETKSFQKRILRTGIKVKMKGITVSLNPQAEFQKWLQWISVLVKDPIFGSRIKVRWKLWMNALRAGRVPDRNEILPPLQELEAEEQQMKQMMAQKQKQEDQVRMLEAQTKLSKHKQDTVKNQMQTMDMAEKVKKSKIDNAIAVMGNGAG